MSHTPRDIYNVFFGVAATVAALVSLYAGITPNFELFGFRGERLGKVLVSLWVLVPPVFFWFDWVFFCRNLTEAQKDKAKHTHDLSRNIWLALIAVLAGAFGLTERLW